MDIGIDLGTTFSVIAVKGRHKLVDSYPGGQGEYLKEYDVTIIPALEGEKIIPSVFWQDPAEPSRSLVGTEAKNKAQEGEAPIMFSKRVIGTSQPLHMHDRAMTGKEVAVEILRYLKKCAERALGEPVRRAVITHPAYFDRNAIRETREAAEMAGFDMSDKRQMLMEPAAATLAYVKSGPKDPLVVLTYDLGGGTFDVTVVERRGGVPVMKAFDGDHLLGGYNFDRDLVQWIRDSVNKGVEKGSDRYVAHDEDNPEHRARDASLLQIAENVKIDLSRQRGATVKVPIKIQNVLVSKAGKTVPFIGSVTREQYTALIQKHLDRTIECCHEALRKAKLTPEQLDYVLLVGGSTAGPWVQEAVEKAFPGKVMPTFSPDLCVGVGAALQAAELSSPASAGGVELAVNAPATSPLPTLNLGGTVKRIGTDTAGLAGITVRLHSPAGTSDKVPAADGSFAFEEVALAEDGPTELCLKVLQAEGSILVQRTVEITYQPEGGSTNAISAVLPKSLFLKTANGFVPIAEEGVSLPAKIEVSLVRIENETSLEIPVYQEGEEVGRVVVTDIPPEAGTGAAVVVTVEITEFNHMRGSAKVMAVRGNRIAAESHVQVEFPPLEVPQLSALQEMFDTLEAERVKDLAQSADPEQRVLLAGRGKKSAEGIKKLFSYEPPDPQLLFRSIKEFGRLVHRPKEDLSPSRAEFLTLVERCRGKLDEKKSGKHLDAFGKALDELEKRGIEAANARNRKAWVQANNALEEFWQRIHKASEGGDSSPARDLPPTPILKDHFSQEIEELRVSLSAARKKYSNPAHARDYDRFIRACCDGIEARIEAMQSKCDAVDDNIEPRQAVALLQLALRPASQIRDEILGIGCEVESGRPVLSMGTGQDRGTRLPPLIQTSQEPQLVFSSRANGPVKDGARHRGTPEVPKRPPDALSGPVDKQKAALSRPSPSENLPAVAGKPLYMDENVQFSVYRPRVVVPTHWYTMLAFAHLSEPREGEENQNPQTEVARQASQILGEQIGGFQDVKADSAHAVPREGEITFVPVVPGVQFNPPSRTFLWQETVHREEFRLRADPSLEGQTARGRLTVFLGSIILADIALSIRVDSTHRPTSRQEDVAGTYAQPYRMIFASYSHKDAGIVEEFERHVECSALGDRYLRDCRDLRAGEVWSDGLLQLIERADVFQLFWSNNSMVSPFVRQEWEQALLLGRQHFVRPVYWEEPMPCTADGTLPPQALRQLHFQRVSFERDGLGAGAISRGNPIGATDETYAGRRTPRLDENRPSPRAVGESHDLRKGLDEAASLGEAMDAAPATKERLRALEGHARPPMSVPLLADGRRAISGSQDSALADTYKMTIDTRHPTSVIFLIDQSRSMSDSIAGGSTQSTKAESVARAVNRCLTNLVMRCSRPEVRRYFDIAMIGYGQRVGPAWSGTLTGRPWVSIAEVADNARMVEMPSEQHEGRPIRMPIWLDPAAEGGTPMCEALRLAQELLKDWLGKRKQQGNGLNVFPPVVVNITGGEAADGDPIPPMREIMQLETDDGHVLAFNAHLATHGANAPCRGPIWFPQDEDSPCDGLPAWLYRMSSELPASLIGAINRDAVGDRTSENSASRPVIGSRGLVLRAGPSDLERFLMLATSLEVGTRGWSPSNSSAAPEIDDRPFQVLDAIQVRCGGTTAKIELCVGDLTALRPEDAVDVLVVSAFPGDYTPLPGSLIGALHSKGLSVESLSRRKEVDLRQGFSCWLSRELPQNGSELHFRRLLCFEPYLRGAPSEVVGDIFRSLAPFVGSIPPVRSVAMPLVAAGYQGADPQTILRLLVETAAHWMSIGLALSNLKIACPGRDALGVLQATFSRLKVRFEDRIAAESERRYTYDLFISYAHHDATEASWIEQRLLAAKPGIRLFLDNRELNPGAAWQQELFEALDDCERVVALLSRSYIASKVCLEEFNIGFCRNRESGRHVLVPLYLYSAPLPTYMRLVQFHDCREFNRERLQDAVCALVSDAR